MTAASHGSESRPPPASGIDDLVPQVYERLCRLARRQLRFESADHSHQTVDLVHEAYLRLANAGCQWNGEGHFLAAATEAMRRILVDRARRKHRQKRGGHLARVELDDATAAAEAFSEEVLLVDDLLDTFAALHPQEAQLAKLHYFGGLTVSEAGRALGIPSSTAHRYWSFARAWLHEALKPDPTE